MRAAGGGKPAAGEPILVLLFEHVQSFKVACWCQKRGVSFFFLSRPCIFVFHGHFVPFEANNVGENGKPPTTIVVCEPPQEVAGSVPRPPHPPL